VHKRHRRSIINYRFLPWKKFLLLKQYVQQDYCRTQLINARHWIFTLKNKTVNLSCVVTPSCIPLRWIHNRQARRPWPVRSRVTLAARARKMTSSAAAE
jgi:hypothetical protein